MGRLGSLITMILILIGAYLGSILVVVLLVLFSASPAPVRSARCWPCSRAIALIPALIMVYVRTAVAVPAIVLERVSGWRGCNEAGNLISGRFWPTFGRMALLVAHRRDHLVGRRRHLRNPGAAIDPNNIFVFDQVASAIAAVFVGPITYIGVTLLYYDIRIRKEGFDIEMLARSL